MEINRTSLIPDFILVRYIAECGLSGSNGLQASARFDKFERVPPICLGPQATFALPLRPLCSLSAIWRMERNWGSHHSNASLRAADALMTIASLNRESLTPTQFHSASELFKVARGFKLHAMEVQWNLFITRSLGP